MARKFTANDLTRSERREYESAVADARRLGNKAPSPRSFSNSRGVASGTGSSEYGSGNTSPKVTRGASYRSGRASETENAYRTNLERQEARRLKNAGFKGTTRQIMNQIRRG